MKITTVVATVGLMGALTCGGTALGSSPAQADAEASNVAASSAPLYEWYFVRAYPDTAAGNQQCIVDGSNGFPSQWRYYQCRHVPANPSNYWALYASQ